MNISPRKPLLILSLFFFALSAVTFAQVPASNHVFVLMLENRSYSQVIGNSSAPYFNSLANTYGLATNYDANSHYSLPNYFWMTTGQYVTLNDGTTATFNVDNVTRYLLAAGKTWKAYEESLPSVGYTGPSEGTYEKNHDPFAYMTDVINSSQVNNIVPFTQLADDIAANQLPNYGLITPNGTDDGHNASTAAVDSWLKANIGPLLASPPFQPGGDGLLFITFDESVDSDCAPLATCPKLPENGGGGHIATLVIGPNVIPGYRSNVFYQHPNVLRTMLTALGISGAPGAAASAAPMSDFFGAGSPPPPPTCTGTGPNQSVTICTPTANSTVTGPSVHITAATTDSAPVKYLQIYLDGVKAYQVNGGSLDTSLSMSNGQHRLTVQASDGTIFKQTIYITVN